MDKAGNTIDFMFRAKWDKAADRRFFEKAIGQNGLTSEWLEAQRNYFLRSFFAALRNQMVLRR